MYVCESCEAMAWTPCDSVEDNEWRTSRASSARGKFPLPTMTSREKKQEKKGKVKKSQKKDFLLCVQS